MVTILVYIAFILIIVSIGYLIRIYLLAKSAKVNRNAEVIAKEEYKISRIVLALFIIFMICAIWAYYAYRD